MRVSDFTVPLLWNTGYANDQWCCAIFWNLQREEFLNSIIKSERNAHIILIGPSVFISAQFLSLDRNRFSPNSNSFDASTVFNEFCIWIGDVFRAFRFIAKLNLHFASSSSRENVRTLFFKFANLSQTGSNFLLCSHHCKVFLHSNPDEIWT